MCEQIHCSGGQNITDALLLLKFELFVGLLPDQYNFQDLANSVFGLIH